MSSSGHERLNPVVMIVDDEPVIRETVVEILREEGFDVVGMSDATHALSWMQRIHPDILLTDVIMPGMNGVELARETQKLLPECRIIIFSGQASATALVEDAREGGSQFELLAKPLHPDMLIRRLRGEP